MRGMSLRGWCAVVAGCGVVCGEAAGQQAIFTVAPTQPSACRMTTRTLWSVESLKDDPTGRGRTGHELRMDQEFVLGLTGDLSASVNVPLRIRDVGDERESGLGDVELTLKHRVWQNDFGAVDTARLSVFGGTTVPTGTGEFGKETPDPFVGATFMVISGRHGFNQAVTWRFTTGSTEERLFAGDSISDVLSVDSAYLYRLSPEEYGAETVGSLYATVELNGVYETDGDAQAFVSPGILYEAQRFALEAGVQIPVWQDVESRPESRFGVTLGVRFLF